MNARIAMVRPLLIAVARIEARSPAPTPLFQTDVQRSREASVARLQVALADVVEALGLSLDADLWDLAYRPDGSAR